MDPRFLITEAYWKPSPEERARPPFWRYWMNLPPNGLIGVFMHAWYTHPAVERFAKRWSRSRFRRHLDRTVEFETLLVDDGAEIIKFWMHLDRDEQHRRLERLDADPLQRWRVGEMDWELSKGYGRYLDIVAETVERTSTDSAPWIVVDGSDSRGRELAVGRTVRDALRRRTGAARSHPPATGFADQDLEEPSELAPVATDGSVLAELDMSLSVRKKDYKHELAGLRARIYGLARRAREERLPVIGVFEGWDAAGKGGAVRRLTSAMDARDYRVIPIAAPNDEERAHHYLWRFWRHLGRAGRMTLFDRSWYGRVLVERVEGFATDDEWRRAYAEIVDFESQLVDFGAVVFKFWIHITSDEQLRRFEQREATPYKRWKLTDEDWRNREKRELYETAVCDMVSRTSTGSAPWTLVEGNDKRHARLKVLRTVADALESALDPKGGGKRRKPKKR
jgi:polyphosphate:AMP phosphotransferase